MSILCQARITHCAFTVPLFIQDDPDFATKAPVATGSMDISGGNFTVGTHHTLHLDLSQEAKTLDSLLYNIFKMSIKGTKQALVQCITFPSYVQVVIVLVKLQLKHMDMWDISRMRCILYGFDKLENLYYQGDAL